MTVVSGCATSPVRLQPDLGTLAIFALEHWLFPLWLRPAEQADELRRFCCETCGEISHDACLVCNRTREESIPGSHERTLR